MRILLLGGTGAIGRPLVRELVARGHEVVATTRDPGRFAGLAELGAEPVVLDALEADAVSRAAARAEPDVVACQVTALGGDLSRLGELVPESSRVRLAATVNAVAAAERAGARRLVAQSIAFAYAPGRRPASEEEPFAADDTARAAAETEAAVFGSRVEGLVARYGIFYGPGTWQSSDGDAARALRARSLPAAGDGRQSLIHVEDAAAATALLCERGDPGAYNVVDDEPASPSEWFTALAEAVGAPPPETVAGPASRAASNAKLRALGWEPRFPTWRVGFREGLA
ncbi:MAG TPA: NAD(P)-dependent oxidoreductase [Gaiellaceae bacterium]|nr:NAD(P)-dependent oxidoreductase [Gaiellaceae bacterium]